MYSRPVFNTAHIIAVGNTSLLLYSIMKIRSLLSRPLYRKYRWSSWESVFSSMICLPSSTQRLAPCQTAATLWPHHLITSARTETRRFWHVRETQSTYSSAILPGWKGFWTDIHPDVCGLGAPLIARMSIKTNKTHFSIYLIPKSHMLLFLFF